MVRFLLPLLALTTSLFAVKITVTNDSSYSLHATIYDKEAKELGAFELGPGHTHIWYDSLYNAKDYAKGPFSVRFTCPEGKNYGTVSRIAENGTARAKAAIGPKKCAVEQQPTPHQDWDNNPPHHKYQ